MPSYKNKLKQVAWGLYDEEDKIIATCRAHSREAAIKEFQKLPRWALWPEWSKMGGRWVKRLR